MDSKKSFKEPSNDHELENEWSEVIRGECFIIRASSAETNGAYSMLEVVADPRNGVPMHVHDNVDEHFIILEGKAFIANREWRQKSGSRRRFVHNHH
jgi:mannose-6-phosphate isomerase-like protein (cupin superfamily)